MPDSPLIDSKEVSDVFLSLLYIQSEIDSSKVNSIPDGAVVVEGVRSTFCFHPDRLNKYKPQILKWTKGLPDAIDEGCSFLRLCNDRTGRQWTGFHAIVEQLVVMGIATGLLKCCAPKEMWPMLPGGVPYYQRFTDGNR